MRVKSSGTVPGLANAQPPGSAKFANGGGWAQVEFTDALEYLQLQEAITL